MTYIIENVHLLKGQAKLDTSLLVEGARILAAKPAFNQYKYMRMDADAFIMTPTHVLYDPSFPCTLSFKERKDYYLKNFLMRGSTLFLTTVKVHFERELEQKLKQAKSDLIDSPIDYVISICIPPRLLTPAFIRKCKRAKVPAIFLEIVDMSDLERIPWGWVKEALFPYNSPIIPIFPEAKNKKGKQVQIQLWSERMKKERVPAVYSDLAELAPISRQVLKQIGIFPNKSNLHSGGELSYNLYHKDSETSSHDEIGLFTTQSHNLAVTVSKGKVIRAGSEVYYRPGKGDNVIIKTPGFFTDNY
jgi:hypothetical protein